MSWASRREDAALVYTLKSPHCCGARMLQATPGLENYFVMQDEQVRARK